MSQNIWMEAQLLFLSIVTGAALMALYDILRIIRLMIRHNSFVIGMEDFLYWLTAGIATFYLLYRENDGSLRFYVIVTVFLTMIIYDRILSRFLIKVLKKAGLWIKIKLLRRNR
ncbi:MAG: spore cortex biosynthesis protein YabQ [Lachnospiraceae bacterium]